MGFFRILRYDIKQGIVRRWYVFLLFFLYSFMDTWMYIRSIGEVQVSRRGYPSMLEVLVRNFAGSRPFSVEENYFEIPYGFSLIFIGLAIVIGDYIIRDIKGCGVNVLICSGGRHKWMLSKLLWCVMSAALVYASICIGSILSYECFATDKTYMVVHEKLITSILYTEYYIGAREVVIDLFCALLTCVLISVVQMLLAFYLDPLVAYVIVLIYMLMSVAVCHIALMGNCMMIGRMVRLVYEHDYPTILCLLLVVVSGVGVYVGRYKSIWK
ncbi:MAG TPA: hypothetical protein DEO82_03920 [Eubacterium sp.]|nr:hypothetical protein [Eubacterium sp.]